jgi:hypothetical protein
MHREKVRYREFITLLGGAAGWPLATYTQAQLKRGTLGFLQADHGQVHRSRSCTPDPACKILTQCSRV